MRKLTMPVLALLALLAGCTGMTRLDAPQLSIVAIRLLGAQQNLQQFVLTIQVSNPNMRQIAVRSIDYRVALAGEDFANGSTAEPFTVPALGEARFDLDVTADIDTAIRLAAQGLLAGDLPYRVTGRVRLTQGALRTLPFTSSGTLSLR